MTITPGIIMTMPKDARFTAIKALVTSPPFIQFQNVVFLLINVTFVTTRGCLFILF